jgi:hypothetical protein
MAMLAVHLLAVVMPPSPSAAVTTAVWRMLWFCRRKIGRQKYSLSFVVEVLSVWPSSDSMKVPYDWFRLLFTETLLGVDFATIGFSPTDEACTKATPRRHIDQKSARWAALQSIKS